MFSPVDKIKEKLDIADVVGSYIKLQNAGSNLKAKCPFHNEKTPSFFVSPDRGTYYCFGCGAKGDIFTFVQEFEGLDFMGAFKILAKKAGVDIKEGGSRENYKEKERLFSLMEHLTFFFQKNLKENQEALNYLKKRGMTDETVKTWRLGYALPEWRSGLEFLKSKGFSVSEMEKVGVVKRKEKAGSKEDVYYDTFRGRIIFPIFDSAGRIVGFSGRIFVEDENAPKYLNSPETSLFLKSEILYGFNLAKLPIRKKDYAILVEGQTDLLMSHQAGIDNTVASSGTALTPAQIGKIKRLTDRLIVAFDSDRAGENAAFKNAELALSQGMEVKVALLPEDSDPADLILDDLGKWKEILRNSLHLVDFALEKVLSGKPEERKLAKAIKEGVLPYIARLSSSMERAHFVKKISETVGIPEESVWEDLRGVSKNLQDMSGDFQKTAKTKEEELNEDPSRMDTLGRRIIAVIYWQSSLEKPQFEASKIKDRLISMIGEDEFEKLEKEIEEEKETLVFEAEAYYKDRSSLDKDLEELFFSLEKDLLKKEFSQEMVRLSQAEKEKDQERAQESLKRCQELSKKISALTKSS